MGSKIWWTLSSTAAAACFAASFAANAGGVFYQSDFDPIGFAGSAKWFVDDNCNSATGSFFGRGTGSTGYQGVNILASGCSVSLYSLTVELWNPGDGQTLQYPDLAAAKADPSGSELVTLTFPGEPNPLYHLPLVPDPHLVLGVYVEDGLLAGVDTVLIGPVCTNENAATAGCYGVQFTSEESPLANAAGLFELLWPGSPLGNLGNKGAYLWQQKAGCTMNQLFDCAVERADVIAGGDGFAKFDTPGAGRSQFLFLGTSPDGGSTVPEPGSLALLGGALVAGWFTRRRKAAA